MASYDIIGDIHGHAAELRGLLTRLGYRDSRGAWRHPDRTVIFLGDFVDRGPDQVETVNLVRRMVDAGTALAVMGNHELNAIAWFTPDPAAPGEYLRPRDVPVLGAKNRRQHAQFLAEVEHDPGLHRELIEWFFTLPLWLDLPDVRVVHACWHPEHVASLIPQLAPGTRLTPELLVRATHAGEPDFVAVECLTKGVETPLPEGIRVKDAEQIERSDTRVRWWDTTATTFRTGAHAPKEVLDRLPDAPLPPGLCHGYADEKPLFVGHYWLLGSPTLLAPNLACVDFSAGRGHPLVAYRYSGEPVLDPANFVASR
ncbi:metallophosphatase [Deltaproteobacteria bacterium]|nr:metallophosphatase [Deltaproteobacteria bacterium]